MALNITHDPALRSWVASANDPAGDFPIQNLPHGVFRRRGAREGFRGGVAIGDQILDLAHACTLGVLEGEASEAAEMAAASSLNGLMAQGPRAWRALRLRLSQLLRDGACEADALRACLVPQCDAEFAVPARIGDYTDFFTSCHHMLNAGRVFRPDAPPLPNFKWLPIAYHGRASSVEVSGAPCHRPAGQRHETGDPAPVFGPARRLDYELELACWIGPGNARGTAIAVDDAERHIFGLGLLNDWSARDVQAWEALPLGPFASKNFLSTVSPWIVTLEALEPYRCALPREEGDPSALPHLAGTRAPTGLDLQLEAWLHTPRSQGQAMRLSRSSFRHGYWSLAQMVAHHTASGCNLRPGDLLGTGTQSGPGEGEQGCLLELTHGGREPLRLPNGEHRGYLEDGDTVVLRAWGERPGMARIGFGECRGTVMPGLTTA